MESNEIYRRLESWYRSEGGVYLAETLVRCVRPVVELAFGYHALQVSALGSIDLIGESRIHHRVHARVAVDGEGGERLSCDADALPLASDSVDMIVAVHVLEFSDQPHRALRELHRVLAPHGHLIVVAFNPWSLLGVGQRLRAASGNPLWRAHRPVGPHRLADWLRVVGCQLESCHHVYPLPLAGGRRSRRMLRRCDEWLRHRELPAGGAYIAHAIKEVAPLTPLPLRERRVERLVGLVSRPAAVPRSSSRSRRGRAA